MAFSESFSSPVTPPQIHRYVKEYAEVPGYARKHDSSSELKIALLICVKSYHDLLYAISSVCCGLREFFYRWFERTTPIAYLATRRLNDRPVCVYLCYLLSLV